MNNKQLYSKDSKGKIRQWKAYTDYSLDSNGYTTITIEHGQQGGKLVTKERKVKKGKNIGKANETTLREQTDLEIGYLYTKQYDQGYVDDIGNYQEPFRPMLAHKYKDRSHKVYWDSIEHSYYCSYKYDGIRCFILIGTDGSISFISRTGKPFKYLTHIAETVSEFSIYKDSVDFNSTSNRVKYILDGELFNPNLSFNIISSKVNSDTYEEGDKEIKFYGYDFINTDNLEASFSDRFSLIKNDLANGTHTELVVQHLVESEEDVMEIFQDAIELGYEGVMIKANETPYVFGKRSESLLKYKEMLDDEFKIVEIKLADNDDTKVQIVLESKNDNKDLFTVGTVKGNKQEVYNKYYRNKGDYIGKYGTVQYQTLSPYGIPLFPVFLDIREGTIEDGQFIPSI